MPQPHVAAETDGERPRRTGADPLKRMTSANTGFGQASQQMLLASHGMFPEGRELAGAARHLGQRRSEGNEPSAVRLGDDVRPPGHG